MVRVTMSNITDSEKPKHNSPQMIIRTSSSLSKRPPFQVMLPLQHQFVGDGHRLIPRRPNTLVVPAKAGTHNPRCL